MGRVLAALKAVLSFIPPLVVLGTIGGLFLWGHKYNWKVPKFSALVGGEAALEAAEEDWRARPEAKLVQPADDGLPALPARLYLKNGQTAGKLGLKTVAAVVRPMSHYVLANGVVDYDRTRVAQLSSRVPGTVWQVSKRVGETVEKDEVLAVIQSSEVGKVKADLLQALVQLDLKTKLLARLNAQSAAVPARQILDTEAALREARIVAFNAQQALVNLGLPVSVEELEKLSDEKEQARRIRLLGLPPDIAAKFAAGQAPANLVPIRAPFKGIVIGRDAVQGEVVTPGDPSHFVIADTSEMWVALEVRLEDSPLLRLGQPALFRPDGLPAPVPPGSAAGERDSRSGDPFNGDDPSVLKGELAWISTDVDPKTRKVEVRLDLANDGRLRANQFGTGAILVRSSPKAVVVPTEALQPDGTGRQLLFVRKPGSDSGPEYYEPRAVRTGIGNGRHTEITAGVADGEEVVVAGSHLLKSEILRRRLTSSN